MYKNLLEDFFLFKNILFYETNIKKLLKIIQKNKKNFFFKIKKNKFCYIYIEDAKWETKILKKKCSKIKFIFTNDNKILKEVFKSVKKYLNKFFWVQYDSQNQEIFIDNLLIKNNFSINNIYYQWEVEPKKIEKKFLIKKDIFGIEEATKKDIKLVFDFFKKHPSPGRFFFEKKISKYSGSLYADWIINILKNKNKNNFVYMKKINNIIYGAQGFSVKKNIANLDILRVRDSFKDTGLGYTILSQGIKKIVNNKNIKTIRTRTSKFNYRINYLLKKLGFKIVGSGINFSKINE